MTEYQPKAGDKVWVVPILDPETGERIGSLFRPRGDYEDFIPVDTKDTGPNNKIVKTQIVMD